MKTGRTRLKLPTAADFPFLPKTAEELAKMFAARVQEAMSALMGAETAVQYPEWVRKMAVHFREQVFSAKASKAVAERDDCFLPGFAVGALIAFTHFMKHAAPEQLAFGQLVSKAQTASIPESKDRAIAEKIAQGTPFAVPEMRDFVMAFVDELASLDLEKRARVLEGILDGSDTEAWYQSGAARPGSAFDVQLLMLLFWREFEEMPSRGAAFRFLEFSFEGTNRVLTEESFTKLAKRYGYKSRTRAND